MTFILRPTTRTDIPVLHRLVRDFATYEKLEHRFDITEAELHAALFGPTPPLEAILAETNGAPVGFALWYLTFSTFSGRYSLFLEDIFVEARSAAAASGSRCSATWPASRWNASAST